MRCCTVLAVCKGCPGVCDPLVGPKLNRFAVAELVRSDGLMSQCQAVLCDEQRFTTACHTRTSPSRQHHYHPECGGGMCLLPKKWLHVNMNNTGAQCDRLDSSDLEQVTSCTGRFNSATKFTQGQCPANFGHTQIVVSNDEAHNIPTQAASWKSQRIGCSVRWHCTEVWVQIASTCPTYDSQIGVCCSTTWSIALALSAHTPRVQLSVYSTCWRFRIKIGQAL